MKKVYCLYRVSTLGQVDKEDIPMQREACREFAKSKGWVVTEEFFEKGISGYKVSSENREALQIIKKAAIQKQFDILLVFMFDRLGRRDDETPFVVEWFVKNGIKVWSVAEGEQRFEDHVDKLINYIRFWQSSGESLKTSIRTKARMEQLVKEGLYIGGGCPYGYRICKLGRTNKHGFEVHDILIDSDEATVVRKIFDLYINDKMGTYRIAKHLDNNNILNRKGTSWNYTSILNVLKNEVYTGIRKFGEVKSDNIPHLKIIEKETFVLAQIQIEKNKQQPRRTRSKYAPFVLFADVLYCLVCRKKMTVTLNKKARKNKHGIKTTYERMKYICINKSDIERCYGQKNYSANIVDLHLSDVISSFLLSENTNHIESSIKGLNSVADQIKALKIEIDTEKQSLRDLKNEVIEVIRGTSAFGSVLISDLIQKSESRIIELENEASLLKGVEQKQRIQMNMFHEICNQFKADKNKKLNSYTLIEQQEVIRHLVSRVYLGSGYEYKIEWKFGGYIQGKIEIK